MTISVQAKSKTVVLLVVLVIGAIDAVVFKGFEYIVNNGTNWLWNDTVHSDTSRWRVLPLALVLGLVFSGLLVLLKQTRLVPPKVNSVEEEGSVERPTIAGLGIVLVVGLASLLAGASLGPEASLVALCGGIGLWFAYAAKADKTAKLFELASVGALLVAFFGSIVPILLPLLLLAKNKKLSVASALPVILACASAFGTLWLMDHNTAGYGTIPISNHYGVVDFPLAAILGLATAFLGWLLKQYILKTYDFVKRIDKTNPWALTGAVFGLIIGLLYLIGGQSVEFSGSQGSHMLTHHSPAYGLGMLVVILLAKLLVTGWSLGTGYRGGLVFPSVFSGVAIALIAENISGVVNPGVMIGSIAGVFSAMLGPIPALIFIIALLPVKLIGVAIVGIIFAAIGNKVIARFSPSK